MKRDNEKPKESRSIRQLNVEMRPEMHRILKMVAAANGLKLTVIAQDAFRAFLGDSSPEIEARRKICVDTVRRLGARSFEEAASLMIAA